jgi:hypothetical protein
MGTVTRGSAIVGVVQKAMPPLWQYLARVSKKGRRVHCCPQRARTPYSAESPLQRHAFLGTTMGTTMAIGGPLWPAPLHG